MTIDFKQLQAARVAVAKGAKLLDDNVPGWRENVHQRYLDMADGTFCILGQVFAKDLQGYFNGYERGLAELDVSASEYGFDVGDGNTYVALGRAWEEELWPELFAFNAEQAIADLQTELPGLISEVIREVFRNL